MAGPSNPTSIVTKMQNQPSESVAIVIAHYHPDGKIPSYMTAFIKHAQAHYSKHIVLVSTNISSKSEQSLSSACKTIKRDNFGYDFWSYKVGLDALPEYRKFKRILLLNSSFIISDPAKLLNALFEHPVSGQMVGLTKSYDFQEHLQSFCILFDGENIVASEAMKTWWTEMTPISDRDEVIQKYEIGMSRFFKDHGYELISRYKPTPSDKLMSIFRAVVQSGNLPNPLGPTDSVVTIELRQADSLNPTHYAWDQLFFKYGVVKLDFLRKSLYSYHFQSILQKPAWRNTNIASIVKDAYYT